MGAQTVERERKQRECCVVVHNLSNASGLRRFERGQSAGVGVQGSGFRFLGAGFRVQGSEFRFQGSGFRVQGSGFWGQGFGFGVRDVGCAGEQTTLDITAV